MRSYSSLLCHILNSNDEIDGYGELGMSYESPLDLLAMRYRVALTTGTRLRGRYVLDKLLHPGARVEETILESTSVRVMIGIRQPEAAVRSIVAMGAARKVPDWKADPTRAARHYTNRLRHVAAVVRRRPDAIVFPSDAIISHTAELLAGLTDRLGLSTPLEPEYTTGSMTGRPRFGDTSPHIKSGTILTERPKPPVELDEEVVDRIWSAYDATLDELFDLTELPLCPEAKVSRGAIPM